MQQKFVYNKSKNIREFTVIFAPKYELEFFLGVIPCYKFAQLQAQDDLQQIQGDPIRLQRDSAPLQGNHL